MTIDELYQIINNRKNLMPQGSYVASLFSQGDDRIIQKVGEEATEVVIAAKNKDKERTLSEVADLWFHLLIMMSSQNITPDEVHDELEKRAK